MEYLHWDEKTITDFSEKNVSEMYEKGYVFTRLGKGVMQQTRSVRIDVKKFNLSSENRRILKKMDGFRLEVDEWLPIETYRWEIAKMAKDFYDAKFGPSIMSAQKIKEMLTDQTKSNFNNLYIYSKNGIVGYAITYSGPNFLHYSYPFYDLATAPKDMGLGMMTMAIEDAKNSVLNKILKNNQRYVYLGSLQRPSDTYKLQFEGLEWFDGKEWQTDLEKVKEELKKPVISDQQ